MRILFRLSDHMNIFELVPVLLAAALWTRIPFQLDQYHREDNAKRSTQIALLEQFKKF